MGTSRLVGIFEEVDNCNIVLLMRKREGFQTKYISKDSRDSGEGAGGYLFVHHS